MVCGPAFEPSISRIRRDCVVLCCVVLCCAVLCCVVLCCVVLCCALLCCPLGQAVVAFGQSVFLKPEFKLLQRIIVCSVAEENSD